ncbi:MAG: SusC/RagA family TonB-linked outer membrane protein [Sphingobacteriales bacterium]|jgi:TonB-linked SusC/RagA family outer membrane protein
MQRLSLFFKPPILFLGVVISMFLLPLGLFAQQKTITGTVKDEAGEPLAGISVTVSGSKTGTTTNTLGKFSISASVGDELIFTSATYEAFKIKVDDRTDYTVGLKPNSSSLNDVVVVGYGRQKKVNLVGAVGTVTVDDKMTSRALPNVSSALSGMVPGLQAVQSSGMAGNNEASLIIRGLGTVNNASPLVVVDGMPDVDINRININDIETISVLKDATSASVYGSRAANGVILITTRSGKGMKKTQLNYTSNVSVVTPTRGMDFMEDYSRSLTLQQWRTAVTTLPSNQEFRNGTVDEWMARGMIDPVRFPNTDIWDIILRQGTFQNHNLSATGGSENTNFFVSAGVKDEKGLQINNDYRQYNARFNFDGKVRKNMNVGFRFNGNWSNYIRALEDGFTDPSSSNTAGKDMQYAISGILPYDPVTGYFGGVMAYNEDPQAYNPYTLYINSLDRTTRQELNSQLYYDWSPIKGLTARLDYALNYYNQFSWGANTPNRAYNFQTATFGSRTYVGDNAGISNSTNTGYKTMLTGRLNYNKKFGRNHDVAALVVYSEEYWFDRSLGASRNDRLHPSLTEINAALTDIQSTSGNSTAEGLQSYIGRLNYTGYNKYLLEANFRVDGSSKFIKGSRFGFFPSVAAGWKFTEEKFLQPFTDKFLTSGKLRISYGSLGNNSGVGRYEQKETLTNINYVTGTSVQRGFANSKMINRFLTWETTTVMNVGLDLSFLNNKLTATLDYYDRLTTGMNRPSEFSIFLSSAYSPAPRTNIGNLRNRGVEIDLAWKERVGKVNYGISLNASYNRNNLESWNQLLLRGNIFLDMPYQFVYTYESTGIAQSWQDIYNTTPQGAAPGDILMKDLNGDGRITADDRKAYSNWQQERPTTTFALTSFVSWKGFDLTVFLQGSAGRKDYWLNIYNNTNFPNKRYAATWGHWNNHWSWDNRGGSWPRLGGSGNNRLSSTYWLDDMSFIRAKNIQLGYTIPQRALAKLGVTGLRIVASAENLGTLTSFRGLDPEKQGDDDNVYPINKSYSIAFNLNF